MPCVTAKMAILQKGADRFSDLLPITYFAKTDVIFMQTLTLNMPQSLRVRLQEYQNEQGIQQADKAVIAILQAYFESYSPAEKLELPTMYNAEDGPCEVIASFMEPTS